MNKILSHTDGPIATLTFNNPDRHNAMSLDMWREAASILDAFVQDPAVRVVILTGAGGKAFVSGADIAKFESERATTEAVATYNTAVDNFSQALIDSPKPTIAMIRGYCIGGGIGIAVCCDLRICNELRRFWSSGRKARPLGYGFSKTSPA